MEIIPIEKKEKWNSTIKSFRNWDIYYLNEYACSLQLHGDGQPVLIYHEQNGGKLCYVMMQEDIAKCLPLSSYLEHGMYYDWTTPYGYGGPLAEGNITAEWVENFIRELSEWCRNHKIISQFFRFHPLMQNQKVIENVCDIVYMKKTVYMDTADKEIIFKNMTPNNRNMVRKALKHGIGIVRDKGERIREFQKIYEATMRNNEAEDYYYFEREYFEYLNHHMKEYIIYFYAVYQGMPVSASIFFYNKKYMHYHLSGTLPEYRKLASANLLLSEAANWAAEQGIKEFHLGGGVGIEDSLLKFKKHFNRNGLLDFCIGRNIFDPEVFDDLVSLRREKDQNFDDAKPFLIKYRA
ncbi:MAG: peptidoglycan bridge formation glycyltransferase FemA/FemB family protein [Lachnospiraceae bacterium]|nr:peptidoglycan bridge formation glycyltransferase FemA/FemB family protein [Lachnospiraceae bacterium]